MSMNEVFDFPGSVSESFKHENGLCKHGGVVRLNDDPNAPFVLFKEKDASL
jgi:hypothetical protein